MFIPIINESGYLNINDDYCFFSQSDEMRSQNSATAQELTFPLSFLKEGNSPKTRLHCGFSYNISHKGIVIAVLSG